MLPPATEIRDRKQSGEKVGLDAEDQPRLQVAPEEVGAEHVPGCEWRRIDQADVHRLRIVGQPAERAEHVRGHHHRHHQQAVAYVDEIEGLRALPQRELRELADGAGLWT